MLYTAKSASCLPVTPSSSLGRYDAKNMITAHVTIPGGIRRILPESLQTLEASAFQRCSSLTYVRIPSGVRYIGEQAFSGCDRMKVLEIDHDPDYLGEHIVNRSTVIRCHRGSAVDAYCREYGYQTEYL